MRSPTPNPRKSWPAEIATGFVPKLQSAPTLLSTRAYCAMTKVRGEMRYR
jgi:hypothetical protein